MQQQTSRQIERMPLPDVMTPLPRRPGRRSRAPDPTFVLLFEQNPLPTWIYDLQSLKFMQANLAAQHRYGYTDAQFRRLRITDITAPEEESSDGTPKPQMTSRGPARHRLKDGALIDVHVDSHGMMFLGRPAVMGVVRDATEQIAAAAEISALNAELENFVHVLSHDLRAPLRAMTGFANALIEDYSGALDPVPAAFCQRIADAAGHMDMLIQGMLAYRRLAQAYMNLAPLDVGPIVDMAMRQIENEIAASSAVIRVNADARVIAGDRSLALALNHLISNAVKFVPPGKRPHVQVHTEALGDRVRIHVTDNGIGVAPEHHERIFRIFERLHGMEDYPGSGIGLAIVQRAVQRMDGTVSLESEFGRGSRFTIELPAA